MNRRCTKRLTVHHTVVKTGEGVSLRENDFAFAVGRVRVLETRLLDSGKFERMLEARDAEEVLRILGETEYAQAFAAVKNQNDYEAVLDYERHRVFELVRILLAPERKIADLYFLRFDLHNLKVLLKAEMTSMTPEGLADEGVFGPQRLQAMISGTGVDSEKAPDYLAQWIERGRQAKASGDPQAIDLALDGAFYRFAAETARKEKWGVLERYWIGLIDLTNVVSTVRCRRMATGADFLRTVLLDGGIIPAKEFLAFYDQSAESFAHFLELHGYGRLFSGKETLTSPAAFENAASNYLRQLIADAGQSFVIGPEPVFAYLLAKENEIRKTRIIIVGKLNGIPREILRERL